MNCDQQLASFSAFVHFPIPAGEATNTSLFGYGPATTTADEAIMQGLV